MLTQTSLECNITDRRKNSLTHSLTLVAQRGSFFLASIHGRLDVVVSAWICFFLFSRDGFFINFVILHQFFFGFFGSYCLTQVWVASYLVGFLFIHSCCFLVFPFFAICFLFTYVVQVFIVCRDVYAIKMMKIHCPFLSRCRQLQHYLGFVFIAAGSLRGDAISHIVPLPHLQSPCASYDYDF